VCELVESIDHRSRKVSGVHSMSAMATALRAKQAPIKDQYKTDPSSAIVTLSSSGTLDSSSITCKLDTGKKINDAKQKVAGLHQKAGGDDPEISGELCSGDMLLEALVACAGVTLKVSCRSFYWCNTTSTGPFAELRLFNSYVPLL
jgi:hypothetical protein